MMKLAEPTALVSGAPLGSGRTTMTKVAMTPELFDALYELWLAQQTTPAPKAAPAPAQLRIDTDGSASIVVGTTTFTGKTFKEESTHEVYVRPASGSTSSAPLTMAGRIGNRITVNRELHAKVTDKVRNRSAVAEQQRTGRATIMLDAPPLQATTTPKKRKSGTATSSSATTGAARLHAHVRQTASADPSRKPPSTTTLPVVKVTTHNHPSTHHLSSKQLQSILAPHEETEGFDTVNLIWNPAVDRVIPIPIRIIHFLALRAQPEEAVIKVLTTGTNADPATLAEVRRCLGIVAYRDKHAKEYILKQESYKHVRPWAWLMYKPEERQKIAITARRFLTKMKFNDKSPEWQHLHKRADWKDPFLDTPEGKVHAAEKAHVSQARLLAGDGVQSPIASGSTPSTPGDATVRAAAKAASENSAPVLSGGTFRGGTLPKKDPSKKSATKKDKVAKASPAPAPLAAVDDTTPSAPRPVPKKALSKPKKAHPVPPPPPTPSTALPPAPSSTASTPSMADRLQRPSVSKGSSAEEVKATAKRKRATEDSVEGLPAPKKKSATASSVAPTPPVVDKRALVPVPATEVVKKKRKAEAVPNVEEGEIISSADGTPLVASSKAVLPKKRKLENGEAAPKKVKKTQAHDIAPSTSVASSKAASASASATPRPSKVDKPTMRANGNSSAQQPTTSSGANGPPRATGSGSTAGAGSKRPSASSVPVRPKPSKPRYRTGDDVYTDTDEETPPKPAPPPKATEVERGKASVSPEKVRSAAKAKEQRARERERDTDRERERERPREKERPERERDRERDRRRPEEDHERRDQERRTKERRDRERERERPVERDNERASLSVRHSSTIHTPYSTSSRERLSSVHSTSSSFTPRTHAPSPLPTGRNELRTRYGQTYVSYMTLYAQMISEQEKNKVALRERRRGGVDDPVELMDPDELEQLVKEYNGLRMELEEIRKRLV